MLLLTFCVTLCYSIVFGSQQFVGLTDTSRLSGSSITGGRPLTLTEVSVSATIRGYAYDVTSLLTYVNKLDKTVEVQFVFPVGSLAAIYKLEAVVHSRQLKAEIRRRSEAREMYQEGVDFGRAAILFESQVGSPDVYRIKLGNLHPNETAIITIGYAHPITRNSMGDLEFILPVVLNPRYIPAADLLNPVKMSENFHNTVPYVALSDVHYKMYFSARIDMGLQSGLKVAGVEPQNPRDALEVALRQNGRVATVRLLDEFVPDHDFAMKIKVDRSDAAKLEPVVFVEPGFASNTVGVSTWLKRDVAAVWLAPDEHPSTGDENGEYWLVVDRSGSMALHQRMQKAKSGLTNLIQSLPQGCTFNIISFGTLHEVLFLGGAAPYRQNYVNIAISHASEMDANLGGTEILDTFNYIYNISAPRPPRRRYIILLTDGEVSNTNDVIDVVRQHAATARVFAIGIGEGVSTALVNGVASASNGLAVFIRDHESSFQAKLISVLKATSPVARNPRLDWSVAEQAQIELVVGAEQPVAAALGFSIIEYGIISSQAQQYTGNVDLSYRLEGRNVTQSLPFTARHDTENTNDPLPLHRLAAKAEIAKIVNSNGYSTDQAKKNRVVELSIETGVLSEETALVAVDTETRSPAYDSSGKPIFVNVARPFGNSSSESSGSSTTPTPPFRPTGIPAGLVRPSLVHLAVPRSPPLVLPPTSNYMTIKSLQKFNGSWGLTADFVRAVKAPGVNSLKQLKRRAKRVIRREGANVRNGKAIATLIGVGVFRHQFPRRRMDWELREIKAFNFLHSTGEFNNVDVFSLIQNIAAELFPQN